MSYFSDWSTRSEDISDRQAYEKYIEHYYELERDAYRYLLRDQSEDRQQKEKKPAGEWAKTLGFAPTEMDVFLGFLEGMQSSSDEKLDLESVTDETPISFSIDYQKLLYNMHDAKAPWLFGLPEWDLVFPKEQREEIFKNFKRDHIAHSEKIGRNDPCPCGSGKKYKKCCGKNA